MSTNDKATHSSPASCIGDRIRRIRTEKGMSQAELGALIGLNADRIQKYENGARQPRADVIKRFASALGVSTLALTDHNTTSCIGAMHAFFEFEENFGATVTRGSDGHSIALSFDQQSELYSHLERWLLEYEIFQAQLRAATSDDEKVELIKEYHKWEWNYPCTLSASEKIVRKNRIKKEIEELQKIYNRLDEA